MSKFFPSVFKTLRFGPEDFLPPRFGGGTVSSSAAIIDSVVAGTFASGAIPITVTATGADTNDDVYWVVIPNGDTTPTASQIVAGQNAVGGSPTDSGTDLWPGPFSDTLVSGITRANYKVCVVIDNGELSNVGVSGAVEIDTVAPVLSLPVGAEDAGDADWSVTSDEATGTIYAALRLSSTSQLADSVIIAGSGTGLIASDTDSTPTADNTNGGVFLSPASDTYQIDIVQVDDYGNISNVVSTGNIVISASATLTLTQIGTVFSNTAANTIASLNQVVNCGAAKTNKIGIIVLSYGQAGGGTGVSTTVNGGSALTPETNTDQRPAIQANSVIYTFDASAGGNHTINSTPQGGAWRGWQMKVYTAEKSDDSAPTVVGDGTSQSGSALMDLSQTVAVDDEIVGTLMLSNYTNQSPVSLVGVTRDGGVQYTNSGSKEAYFVEATAVSAGTRTMTATPAGGTDPITFSLVKVT